MGAIEPAIDTSRRLLAAIHRLEEAITKADLGVVVAQGEPRIAPEGSEPSYLSNGR